MSNRLLLPLKYLFAITTVALALLLSQMMRPFDSDSSPLFFLAVMLSSYFGGLGPGLLATLLSGFCTMYFYADPPYSPDIGLDDLVRVLIFLAEAILISYLHALSRRATRRMQQARDVAEQANHSKDHFLAVLSHELRMPLTPVLIAASALELDESLPRQVRDDMWMIRRNVELESRLIDDLLNLARLGKGKLVFRPSLIDAHGLIRHAMSICDPDARDKGLTLTFLPGASNPSLTADPARFQQIIWNLLRNAVKFTPPGGTVTLRTRNQESRLIIEIQDTGIGIPPDKLAGIFDPFQQGGAEVTRRFGGLGLGLAISKALVEQQGGQIRAQSPGPNQGATFTVEFPTTPGKPASAALPDNPKSKIQNPKLKILLVEDHLDTLRMMERLLTVAHHDVKTASCLDDAINAASHDHFDLVISDLGLPDGSGLDLMRRLRSLYGLKGIALSGYGQNDDLRQSADAGFVQHLTKPINFDSLSSAIARAIH